MLLSELMLLGRRRSTQAMLLASALIPIVLTLLVNRTTVAADLDGLAYLRPSLRNGLFIAVATYEVSVPWLLPLAIATISATAIAGETNLGTLRSLVLRPASRRRILGVKFLSCLITTFTLVAVATLVGIAFGQMNFGNGSGLNKVLEIALFIAVSTTGLSAVGLFFSTLTDQPINAAAGTLALVAVSYTIGLMDWFEAAHDWLLTSNWLRFDDFINGSDVDNLFTDALVLQGMWTVAFLAAAHVRLARKDIS